MLGAGLTRAPRLVYHLSGVLESQALAQLTGVSLERADAPKAPALATLIDALQRNWNHEPQRTKWVLFGSVAALRGTAFAGAYAAANGALLGAALALSARGVPVSWMGWSAWKGLGMSRGVEDEAELAREGLQLLDVEQAVEITVQAGRTRPNMCAVGVGAQQNAQEAAIRNATSLTVKTADEFAASLLKLLERVMPQAEIGLGDNFFDLGGTSVELIQFQRLILGQLEVEVDITTLLQYPSVNRLTAHLFDRGNMDSPREHRENRRRVIRRNREVERT